MTNTRVPFAVAVEDVTGGNPKIQSSGYQTTGRYPVIDQGQEFIAGFTDDIDALCRQSGPLVLFGDHTRIFKYVDIEFALGADGVKVLKCKEGFNPRFIFHYLRTVYLPTDLGYSRHFKYLKECSVPKIPLEEQKRIAAILDKVESLRRKRQEAIQLADDFLRAVFLDMFGDPVTNPKGWPEISVKELATVTTGNTPSREVTEYYGDHIEWIKSDNINTPKHYLATATEGLSEKGFSVGRWAPAGATLITCIAGSPSCIGNAALADRPVSFNQQINALTPKGDIEPEFLYALVLYSKRRIQAASTEGMKGMVSKGALEQIRLISPDQALRQRFIKVFHKVMESIEQLGNSLNEANTLFQSLSHRAFQGTL